MSVHGMKKKALSGTILYNKGSQVKMDRSKR